VKETKNPKTLEDCPTYTAAYARLPELQIEERENQGRISAVLARLAQPGASIQDEAAAMLAGDSAQRVNKQSLFDELGMLQHRAQVLHAAVELQQKKIETERMAASKAICATLAPEWMSMIKAIRTKVNELLPLLQRENIFRQDLARSGVCLCEPICNEAGVANYEATTWKLQQLSENIGRIVG
jgi:hypothetical protein